MEEGEASLIRELCGILLALHRQLYCLVYDMYLHVICPSLVHTQKKFKKEEKANPHKINSALSKFLSNSFPICPVDSIVFKSSLYAYCE